MSAGDAQAEALVEEELFALAHMSYHGSSDGNWYADLTEADIKKIGSLLSVLAARLEAAEAWEQRCLDAEDDIAFEQARAVAAEKERDAQKYRADKHLKAWVESQTAEVVVNVTDADVWTMREDDERPELRYVPIARAVAAEARLGAATDALRDALPFVEAATEPDNTPTVRRHAEKVVAAARAVWVGGDADGAV